MCTAKNYIDEVRDSFPGTDIVKENYYPKSDIDTYVEQTEYTPTLPLESDIFSELPKDVYDNEDIKTFLNYLRKVISCEEYADIVFPKLHLSVYSDEEILIEWVYKFVRVFFSFNSEGDNYYGLSSNNPVNGLMFNYTKDLDCKNYEEQSKEIVNEVVNFSVL